MVSDSSRSASPDTEWEVGKVVADLYEVREVIRSGGMGVVWTWEGPVGIGVLTHDATPRLGGDQAWGLRHRLGR
jgi:hypothetical protein